MNKGSARKYINYFCLFFIIFLGSAVIVSTGAEDEESPCFNFSATGNFTYSSETNILTIDVDESSFPGDIGLEGEYYIIISETNMIWTDDENNELMWSRKYSITDDINGLWTRIVQGINYSLTMNTDNTFSLQGKNCY